MSEHEVIDPQGQPVQQNPSTTGGPSAPDNPSLLVHQPAKVIVAVYARALDVTRGQDDRLVEELAGAELADRMRGARCLAQHGLDASRATQLAHERRVGSALSRYRSRRWRFKS